MSLNSFFTAKSAAIIGASTEVGSIGYSITQTMKQHFKGRVYPVNPHHKKVFGLACYPSVLDIPRKDKRSSPVDIAVIVVPIKFVPDVLKECVKAKIGGVVLITAGYSEAGNKEAEEELKKIIKGSRTRIIGANCLGILDTNTGVDTLFLPAPKLSRPKKGGISFLSQSGAFGSTFLDLIAYEDVGLSKFVSYGNQTDVKDWELLEFLGNDSSTEVIVIYMEGVSDGRKFLSAAKKVSEKKPIIVYKAGKTDFGSKAASSHTGSLAGAYEIYKTAFHQGRILEAQTVEEIYDMAKAVEFLKKSAGDRIAVVTNGGGFGVVTADCVVSSGLKLPEFSPETREKLKKILPGFAQVHNPLDLIGDADVERYEKALEILVKDENVDGIIVIALLQTVSLKPEVYDAVVRVKQKTKKPIIVSSTGGEYTEKFKPRLERNKIPVYLTPERAVRAMKALVKIR